MLRNSHNVLPGVPLCEQPFFDDHFDANRTSPIVYNVAKDLHEKGYAIIDFPDPDFDALAETIKSSLADRYDWQAWRENRAALRIQDAWEWNAEVRRLATNQTVLQLLEDVYGRRAHPFQTLNFPVGTQQHFHTDSVHFSSMPERWMCGVWVALEDIHADAGPLIYYPGSHKWPVYVNEHIGHTHRGGATGQEMFEPLWRRLVEHHGVQPDRLCVPKGKALIWAANLLHGGDAHHDKARTRWSQVTHYYFEGCSYYTPMQSDPALGSIAFREPVSLLTQAPMINTYGDDVVSSDFIRQVNPDAYPKVRLSLPPGFDPAGYLRHNPDVAAAGVDPTHHYVLHGAREGRTWA